MIDFALPPALEADEPPEARGRTRDGVRLLVSRKSGIGHHVFTELPELLDPGDLLVVNTSATLPAAIRLDRLAVHFSAPSTEDGGGWLVELRRRTGRGSRPYRGGSPGEWLPMPGGATLTLLRRRTDRLWQARLSTDVLPYLRRHGVPIRYGHVRRDWPPAVHQTAFALDSADGGAQTPGAGRPFTPELVTRLVSRGVLISPLSLHTGVTSPEADEPPHAERYSVPAATAALAGHVRSRGGRVIAVGGAVVRALETAAGPSGEILASSGWTEHVVTPERGVRTVDGILTGLHRPRSPHLPLLTAVAGVDVLRKTYNAALTEGYLWHEFGDLTLILP